MRAARTESSEGSSIEAPEQPGMLDRFVRNPALRLLLYYTALYSAMAAVRTYVPGFVEALDRERSRYVGSGGFGFQQPPTTMTTEQVLSSDYPMVVAMSMVIAMLCAVPVAWMYSWTSRRATYSRTFAQTLVVFPVAIATVVFLVKGSLALAFSLAGIVAAVRFRNQLSATRDAVFVFVAVGIGLAAGVQLILIAMITSAIFNFGMLLVHGLDFGAKPLRLEGFTLARRARRPSDDRAGDRGNG